MMKDNVNTEDATKLRALVEQDDHTPVEVRHAYEEVVTRNVVAIKDFTQNTRKMVRGLEDEVKSLKLQIAMQNELMEQYTTQLAGIQMKLYSGGTTEY